MSIREFQEAPVAVAQVANISAPLGELKHWVFGVQCSVFSAQLPLRQARVLIAFDVEL